MRDAGASRPVGKHCRSGDTVAARASKKVSREQLQQAQPSEASPFPPHETDRVFLPQLKLSPSSVRLHGGLERVSADGIIEGWCWSPQEPAIARTLAILIDGMEIARVSADQHRSDLQAAGIGNGKHAFRHKLDAALIRPGASAAISLRDLRTRTPIGKSITVEWPRPATISKPQRPAPEPTLRGNLDRLTPDGWVTGWCFDPNQPGWHADLAVLVDTEPVATVRADVFRPDLQQAGIGDGAHGFGYQLPRRIWDRAGPRRVTVAHEASGFIVGETSAIRFSTAPIQFSGSTAILRLGTKVRVGQIKLDNWVVDARHWRVSQTGALRVRCPPWAFDTSEHCLTMVLPEADKRREVTFRSEYRSHLDQMGEQGISGWIYDALRPNVGLTLQVRCGDRLPTFVQADRDRPDLAADDHPATGVGFSISFPARTSALAPEVITISVAGTAYQPFGAILRGADLFGAVSALAASAQATKGKISSLLYRRLIVPEVFNWLKFPDAEKPVLPLPGVCTIRSAEAGLRGPPRVAILVYAERGGAETLASIRSILANSADIHRRILVIEDSPPDSELGGALTNLARSGRLEYVREGFSRGYVAATAHGLGLLTGWDVVLLDAGTIVPPGFVERLYRAAYSDSGIASAVPLSNGATPYSLPVPLADVATPYGLSVEALDAICRDCNRAVVRDIPFAHGHCVFLKCVALEDVGWSEKGTVAAARDLIKDFSMRAQLRGWGSAVAADVYVANADGAIRSDKSATEEPGEPDALGARLPHYASVINEFIRTDPLYDVRNAIQKAIWRRLGPMALMVNLALPGGAARHAGDVMDRLVAEGHQVLALSRNADNEDPPRFIVRRWKSGEALRYPPNTPIACVLADILDLTLQFIHVQHLIDLPDGIAEFVRDSGIPYVVTLHDFFYACPNVTLTDAGGAYCGMPPADKCTPCVRQGSVNRCMHGSLVPHTREGELWRAKWDIFLRGARQLIAPSQDTAERYAHLFPGLRADVRPHFRGVHRRLGHHARYDAYRRIRVAVPGTIQVAKGAADLIALVRYCARWAEDVRFVIVGETDRNDAFAGCFNVKRLGAYEPTDALLALRRARCRVALFCSIFPETYCYTLSESLEAGLVPVGYDFGAIGERLRALSTGVLVELGSGPEAFVAAIRKAAEMEVKIAARNIYARYPRLLDGYYAPGIQDGGTPRRGPRLLIWPEGLSETGHCGGTVTLELWSETNIREVTLHLAMPDSLSFQTVQIELEDEVLQRVVLPGGEDNIFRLDCLGMRSRLLRLLCRFDIVVPLQDAKCFYSARLLGVTVTDASGVHAVPLPQCPKPSLATEQLSPQAQTALTRRSAGPTRRAKRDARGGKV